MSYPLTGMELVVEFYKLDVKSLLLYDDSSGYIGDLFRYAASDLFTSYAARFEDKRKIADLILKLNTKDQ